MLLLAMAFFAPTLAVPSDFESRRAEAQRLEKSAEGAAYVREYSYLVGAAMRGCVPPGSADPANLGKFSLVADILGNGQPYAIDVKPKTAVASCFAGQIIRITFPTPPNNGGKNYVVVIDMSITP
ncbi:hypothetical protein [Pinirhizobacter soli]|uniref:hypothetical protein n=1 Tax=Pinirhizobacter soli TaxID=2786953 RepID=UPI00202A2B68|nr:hypothetical protein [Pinirhizobacter soli]